MENVSVNANLVKMNIGMSKIMNKHSFNCFIKLCRVTCVVFRLKHNCKAKIKDQQVNRE